MLYTSPAGVADYNYFHARRNISPRVQIVSYARLGYYVIDEGSCDESRWYGRNGPSRSNYSFHTGSAEVNRKC